MPPGTTPPLVLQYNASSVPILQLGLSGAGLTEQQLGDLATNFLRTSLVTIPGAAVPYPYGGKQRQVEVDLNPAALQSKGLSPLDVVNALSVQNLILPAGTAKIGSFEYQVDMNGATQTVEELNDMPIKSIGNSTIYIKDVAYVRDGFPPQTNIVRVDGQRSALMVILKNGNASTLDIISGIKAGPAEDRGGTSRKSENPAAFRSIDIRKGLDLWCDPRRGRRRMPYRFDDPAIPGQLAEHADHRRLDSPVDSDVPDCAERSGRDDQHHDARRLGAGRRHFSGRRDGGN